MQVWGLRTIVINSVKVLWCNDDVEKASWRDDEGCENTMSSLVHDCKYDCFLEFSFSLMCIMFIPWSERVNYLSFLWVEIQFIIDVVDSCYAYGGWTFLGVYTLLLLYWECLWDLSHVISPWTIEINELLTYEGVSIAILDRQVRKLRTKEIGSVKVLCWSWVVEEATWEA